jgi:hypothetical protein
MFLAHPPYQNMPKTFYAWDVGQLMKKSQEVVKKEMDKNSIKQTEDNL